MVGLSACSRAGEAEVWLRSTIRNHISDCDDPRSLKAGIKAEGIKRSSSHHAHTRLSHMVQRVWATSSLSDHIRVSPQG